jgi:hypothetical protein
MSLGIAAIVLDCCCAFAGPALGIAAIITGIIAMNKVKDGTGGGKGMALAGIICGAIGIVAGIGLLIFSFAVNGPSIMEQIQQMQQMQQQ